MDALNIKILGNGGCLNNGLPYNAFLINNNFLIEAPPDIMLSINKLKLNIEEINKIYISHLHGDHTFGMPFVIITKWLKSLDNKINPKLIIYGPKGIDEYIYDITEYAFSKQHPCYIWIKDNIEFNIIKKESKLQMYDYIMSFFELQHISNTHGFLFSDRENRSIFSYIADTKWCDNVEKILNTKPRVVLIDMNGNNNIHISLNEVIDKGIKITKEETLYYGIHLLDEFEVEHKNIKCARQGEEIYINVQPVNP